MRHAPARANGGRRRLVDGRAARTPGSASDRLGGHRAEHGAPGRPCATKRVDVVGADLDDEAAGRLGEQRGRRRRRGGSASTVGAEAAGDAHLGQRDGQPALAEVVARAHEPGADRRCSAPVAGRARRDRAAAPRRRLGRRRRARGRGGCRRTRRRSRRAASTTLPGAVELGGDAAPDVGHVGDGGDDQRRRDGVALRRRRRCTRCSASPCRRRTARRRRAAASWQPRTAATSSPSVAGRRGSPHEKLSSSATRSGSAPTATTLRIASSTTACAIASGSCSAVPRVDADADGEAVGVARVGEHDAVAGPVAGRRRPAGARRCRRRSRGRSGGSSSPWRRCWGGPSRAQQRRRRVGDAAPAGRAVGRRQRGGHRGAAAGRRGGTRCRGRARRRRRGGRRAGRRR